MQLLDMRPDHIELVQRILRQHVPSAEVWAFGSRAKWLARDTSDLDLCIRATAALSFEKMGTLREAFEESNLPYKVDVVDWTTTSESFRKIIERDKVVVQKTTSHQCRLGGVGLAGEWTTLTVAECASSEPYSTQIGPFGDKIRAENYTATGAPVLRGTNVNPDGRFHDDDFVFIDSELAEAEFGKFVCEVDDVILCHKGTLGKIGVIPKKSRFKKYIMGNSMMKVRCDRSKLEPLYLYYWLCSRDGQDYIFSRVSQVGVPQIQRPLSTLREASFPVPPLAEQKAIAAVLGALDDKIELNRRMNATLEAMARALFQSWFVDFDPVRAKLDGRPPAAIDPATAALFPEHLEDSKLGHIPRGWEVKTIESLCDVITSGGTPARMHKAYWEPSTVPWFKTGELMDGPLIDAEEKISEEGLANSSCKLWPAGTILFALYASPTVGRFGVLTKPGTANQAAAALIAKPAYGVPFLMGLLYEARAELQRVAVGAAQQNINQGVLKSHLVIAPPPALAKAYSDKVAPWFEQRIKLAEQSRTLATLRDTLLPKLLSGELSTERANEQMKEVLHA